MKKALTLAVASALLTMGVAANAATVVQTSATVIDITHLATSTTFGFTPFDTTLGTLTSAQYTFYSTISGTARAENLGAAGLNAVIGSGAALTLSVAGLTPLNINAVYSQAVTLQSFDGTEDFGGTSGVIKPFTGQAVTSSSALLTSPAALTAFTSGTLTSSVKGVFSGSGSGNVSFSGNSRVNTYAVLTYNYTAAPVPEPETYGMLLAGLGLIGVVARRRKAKKAA